ncbi:LOW QUALITY PROTEIN: MFS transporter [Aspergillus luchuensis]|uniref:MFS transporter n=1 Tax=Aspergillus kawachii TaxID=1069201 RepID=A0A146FSI0_ASPKA|nr:LOW QUALITY PROTEIN: MFS transporter [Aspergillus luchuensis]
MADVGSHHFVKASSRSDRVLVPQPSQSPHDPLNWSKTWKITVICLSTAVSFSQGLGPLALAPMFPQLMEAFDTDYAAVVKFTGVCILVLGFSNFFCYMGACVLNGFGAGPAEVGPIIAGPMAQHVGWRSFFWFNVALLGLVLILVVFLFPETKWHRVHPGEDTHAQEVLNSSDTGSEPEKTAAAAHKENASIERSDTDPWLGRGYPSKQQFKLWQLEGHNLKNLLISFWVPWKLLCFPIVEFAAFNVSWSASVFLTLNLTQSEAFSKPPYNFSSQTIGFFNFAIWIGAFIGLATNGPLSDWISMKATKRNRGIREPEMRLPAIIPYVIVSIIGNFVVAFGYQYQWDWRVSMFIRGREACALMRTAHQAIVIIGYTAAGIQVAAIPAITSTYAVDSYKPVAGSIFVSITVNKNVWGYGFSEFITPWVEKSGFVKPIMLNMSLAVLWCLFAIPFYFYGKRLRKWTAKSSVHKM